MRLKIGAFLGLTALVFLAATVITVALPHSPYIRYQSFQDTIFSRLDWIYERVTFDPTPIDVLIIGSSRSARGISASVLETELEARGHNVHVANLSLPSSGFDLRITELREALARHQPRLVIWSVVEAFPRDGHQAFADLATTKELLTSPLIVNRKLPANLARLPYRQIEYWMATNMPSAFGKKIEYVPADYVGTTPDLRLFNDPDWNEAEEAEIIQGSEHVADMEQESKRRLRDITPPILPKELSWIEFGVSQHYVKELVQLSKSHDFKIAFLFLPFYKGYEAPIEEDWLLERGPVWKADFLMNDAVNYLDAAHVSYVGASSLLPWVADHVAAELSE